MWQSLPQFGTGVLYAILVAAAYTLAVSIAGLPDMVRGYEEIKLGNVRAYRERMAELLAEFTAVVPRVTS